MYRSKKGRPRGLPFFLMVASPSHAPRDACFGLWNHVPPQHNFMRASGKCADVCDGEGPQVHIPLPECATEMDILEEELGLGLLKDNDETDIHSSDQLSCHCIHIPMI